MQGSNGETVAATSDGPLEYQVGSLTLADDQSADIDNFKLEAHYDCDRRRQLESPDCEVVSEVANDQFESGLDDSWSGGLVALDEALGHFLGRMDPKQLEAAAKQLGGKMPGGMPGLGGGGMPLPPGLSGFGKKK